ncbi:MAG TPA: glycoside hydrolase family 3 N-terminal domain-containing protein [Candidatus Aminicenantes bacterium]|nr:glycoside hydrolase family 3 N-terminal domain-containing protein [Candidatus Aminicenantes bacterium]HRY66227.1 glycoside hydrolase family 3 N-terminal domain-containing protein [Candidatus Aminicenantes bacterium]HRZ73141.1 glycoside hydrolase family 3 N-terminal domain-containing protein [Candidatus Aminicenantes bacterium]
MKRPSLLPAAALLLAFAVAGCARGPAPEAAPRLAASGGGWVARTLRKMTIEEKVGQMVACRFTGEFRNADSAYIRELERLVAESGIGGLVLFAPARVCETAELVNAFQKLAKVPLLVASDFERGAANRVTAATLFPPLMALGATGSEELAYAMGRTTALEGRAMGVHVAYAPVVDVNINPDNPIINTRSIGADPALVARLAGAFIRGVQDNGMIATAKHFPGHGDTSQDSHSLLPTIAADRARLEKVELFPFQAAIDAGVRSVMTAHLAVPALDPTPGLPATLSAPILTGVLRQKMGFRGLVVTDALEMGGVTSGFSTEEAALRAVLAGVDQLLLPPEPARVIAYLAAAVRDGRIPPARIDESVRRILEAKAAVGLSRNRFVDVAALRRRVAPQAALDLAAQVLERSVTLVKNDGPALPLAAGAGKLAVLALSSDLGDYFAGQPFVAALRSRFPQAAAFYADADTGQERLDEALAAAAEADVAVLALFSRLADTKGTVGLEPRHVDLIRRLAARPDGPKVVVLSFGSPYLLRHFPEVDAYLCLYKDTAETQAAGARAVCGEMDIGGKLPVSIPGLYEAGHGLELKMRRTP